MMEGPLEAIECHQLPLHSVTSNTSGEVTQDLIQSGFEYFQGQKFHKELILVFDHLHDFFFT